MPKCELCGRWTNLETHHLMNGNGLRKRADEDGLVIKVCRDCHNKIHANSALRLELKRRAQHRYMSTHSLEEWMARYHKNYL